MTPVATLREQFRAFNPAPSPVVCENAGHVFAAMEEHLLDATLIEISNTDVCLTWIGEFNRSRSVLMKFNDNGHVTCAAMEQDHSTKTWEVTDTESDHLLTLTLAETMEYIRHFMWANHNI